MTTTIATPATAPVFHKPTHMVTLKLKSVNFDLDTADVQLDDSERAELFEKVSQLTKEPIEFERYATLGECIDTDVLADVLIDELDPSLEDLGIEEVVTSVDIDWSESYVEEYATGRLIKFINDHLSKDISINALVKGGVPFKLNRFFR